MKANVEKPDLKKIEQKETDIKFYLEYKGDKKVTALYFFSRIEEREYYIPLFNHKNESYTFMIEKEDFVFNNSINDIWDLYLLFVSNDETISKKRVTATSMEGLNKTYNFLDTAYIEPYKTKKNNISLKSLAVSETLNPLLIDTKINEDILKLKVQCASNSDFKNQMLIIKNSDSSIYYEFKALDVMEMERTLNIYEINLRNLEKKLSQGQILSFFISYENDAEKNLIKIKSLNLFNRDDSVELSELYIVPKVKFYGDIQLTLVDKYKYERKFNRITSVTIDDNGILKVKGKVHKQVSPIKDETIKFSIVLKNKEDKEIEHIFNLEDDIEDFEIFYDLINLYNKQNFRDNYFIYFKYQIYSQNKLLYTSYSKKQKLSSKIERRGVIVNKENKLAFLYLGGKKGIPAITVNDYSLLSRVNLNSRSVIKSNKKRVINRVKRQKKRINTIKQNRIKQIFSKYSEKEFNKKTIVFESFGGKQYSDSPKAIYEEMKKKFPNYQFFWVTTKESIDKFKSLQIPYVIRNTEKWAKTLAQSQYWVMNSRLPNWIEKPKHTTYVQTWHGTPLKKLGIDIEEVSMPGTTTVKYKKNFLNSAKKWDYLISPNKYSTEIFKRAFSYENTVLEIGYPRNDSLINGDNPRNINFIKEKLNIPKEKKVILYAPTWRDNQFYSKGKYRFDIPFDMNLLSEQLSDDYIIIFRMHYLIAENIDFSKYKGFIYDFSYHEDISELYLISDFLITDYSSVFFDYAILNRPMFFYAYDIELYRDNLRGFYLDYEESVPGPVIEETDSLIEAILDESENKEKYDLKRLEFREQFCKIEDGKSTERLINHVFKDANY